MKLKVIHRKILSDTLSPVLCFTRIRSKYQRVAMLESNDYSAHENSKSIIGFDPLVQVKVDEKKFTVAQSGHLSTKTITDELPVSKLFQELLRSITLEGSSGGVNGFFGHTSFEAVQHFETIQFQNESLVPDVPLMNYFFYRYLLVFDHYHDMLTIVENCPSGELPGILDVIQLITSTDGDSTGSIDIHDDEKSTISDEDYKEMVRLGKHHCQRGDVFQIVPSRRFSRTFTGDDFMIYRVLRTVNPSPYLFYFDFGDYCIFGSSPEQQLVIEEGLAKVNPIAGTYKRTGNDLEDRRRAEQLANDPKEQAEHMMLVDLARNDLGRHTNEVRVSKMKEIKYYSHVIHLVSQVVGKVRSEDNPVEIFGDTFPAGTLSGAPKFKAMQLIDHFEPHSRDFYGGGIGYFGLDGSLNHAIVIRSILSVNNELHYQAGAGVVEKSDEESELNEVENKLGAIRRALELTNQLFKTSAYETIDR